MLAAYTELKNAEKVKQHIIKKGLMNTNFLPVKEFSHLYFPIKKRMPIPLAKIVDAKFSFPERQKTPTIEELLKNELTKKQLASLPKSQEIVGGILILEIPVSLKAKEKAVAEAYLKLHKNIVTVVKKESLHAGIYRTRKARILAGKKSKETIHCENGIKIKLDLEKVYFSARLSGERLRIAGLVKENELVLVMFSGAAPYPLVIAKNSPAKLIYGVELNPMAHNYALGNINLNNFNGRIILLLGDVRKVVPKIRLKFDRIVMPLPRTGEEFLGVALKKAKKSTIIHLYAFLTETEINKYAKRAKKISRELKHPVKILRKVRCGQFSPGVFRVCFDLKVLE